MSYRAVTRDIEVIVTPSYLEHESSPRSGRWFWAYEVAIVNRGDEAVKLQARYWRITDANGQVQEVRGEGVVGKQPVIRPGETFNYTSGCPLGTPEGIMVGQYFMVSASGETFAVDIPAFSLDGPREGRRVLH